MSGEIKKKIAILISGRGSNMQSLISAMKNPEYPALPDCVIADRASAAGLLIAQSAGVKIFIAERSDYSDKIEFENRIREILTERKTDFICLAGFMQILSSQFCADFSEKILNIHPSLLPAFRGLDTHARAIAAGVKFSGCSVHYVTAGIDKGKIIAQAAVKVSFSDTEESLAKKILRAEHIIYPAALRAVIEGKNTESLGYYFPEE